MMIRYLWFALVALFATNVMAEHIDYTFFLGGRNQLCVKIGKALGVLTGYDGAGAMCVGSAPSVSIRIIEILFLMCSPLDYRVTSGGVVAFGAYSIPIVCCQSG